MCREVHSLSYNNSILHNFFLSMTLIQKNMEKNFDNKKDVHILAKYNKEKS